MSSAQTTTQQQLGSQRTNFQKEAGDERIAKLTSTLFNPRHLKYYQIAFVLIFVVYIWLTVIMSTAPIIKALLVVTLLSIAIIELVIIMSYIE